MMVKACVRSGECCRQAPCGFGRWNESKTACTHLVKDSNEQHSCGIYEDIIKDPTAIFSPAFGSGCCRTMFNEKRTNIINNLYNKKEQLIEVDWDYK